MEMVLSFNYIGKGKLSSIIYFIHLKSVLELKMCFLMFVRCFWDNKECFRDRNKFIEVLKMFYK
jgi:hypothetical protein